MLRNFFWLLLKLVAGSVMCLGGLVASLCILLTAPIWGRTPNFYVPSGVFVAAYLMAVGGLELLASIIWPKTEC